jgi:ribonuclease P protein component
MHSRVMPLRASAAISQALRAPVVQRTAHFALHLHAGNLHDLVPLAGASRGLSDPPSGAAAGKLSTGTPKNGDQPVDNAATAWLACVVPKRHAKRAVTRNLIKRQIRSTSRELSGQAPDGLAAGAYVVRLNRPFQPALFHSASSERLRVQVRTELCGLWQRVLARQQASVAGAHPPPVPAG